MKTLIGAMLCASAMLGWSAPPAVAADAGVQVDWNRTAPASGQVVDGAAVVTASDAGGAFPLVVMEDPHVTAPGYAVVGNVRYQGVAGRGYLEMWSVFPDGNRYFSRTVEDSGSMAALSGDSDWREFQLPFELGTGGAPSRLEIDVVLPGAGTVSVGPLRLVPLDAASGGEGWWSARTGGLVGGTGGALIGVLGAVIGGLTSRRRARRFVLGAMWTAVGVGCALLVTGGVAVALSQPYAVYFPLLLGGALLAGIFGGNLRTARRAFADAELRKMRAMDAV